MNGIDFTKILATLLAPVTDYLKQHGVWDPLVKIYVIIAGVVTSLWSWLSSNIDTRNATEIGVSFLKFILNIFLTLFGALSNIATWMLHLFK